MKPILIAVTTTTTLTTRSWLNPPVWHRDKWSSQLPSPWSSQFHNNDRHNSHHDDHTNSYITDQQNSHANDHHNFHDKDHHKYQTLLACTVIRLRSVETPWVPSTRTLLYVLYCKRSVQNSNPTSSAKLVHVQAWMVGTWNCGRQAALRWLTLRCLTINVTQEQQHDRHPQGRHQHHGAQGPWSLKDYT